MSGVNGWLTSLSEYIGGMSDELDDVKAENAKLLERIHELEMEGSDHFYRTAYAEDANRTLEDENAKLRELVRVMAYCNQFRRDCDGCRMNGVAGIITERAGCDELLARLRELGVGVTE